MQYSDIMEHRRTMCYAGFNHYVPALSPARERARWAVITNLETRSFAATFEWNFFGYIAALPSLLTNAFCMG